MPTLVKFPFPSDSMRGMPPFSLSFEPPAEFRLFFPHWISLFFLKGLVGRSWSTSTFFPTKGFFFCTNLPSSPGKVLPPLKRFSPQSPFPIDLFHRMERQRSFFSSFSFLLGKQPPFFLPLWATSPPLPSLDRLVLWEVYFFPSFPSLRRSCERSTLGTTFFRQSVRFVQ